MQTITKDTTKTDRPEVRLPAIRRTDEILDKRDAARREIADALAGLSRAEIGIIAKAKNEGTNLEDVENAIYYDGYDAEEGRFVGATRRLSDAAREKAIRSLLSKGLIRIEGSGPSPVLGGGYSPYKHSAQYGWLHRCYGPGNSDIRLYDENSEAGPDYGSTGTVTTQQFAVWYVRYLLGETERNPAYWVGGRLALFIRIVLSDALRAAFEVVAEIEDILHDVRSVSTGLRYVESVEVAEIIKPEPTDLLNAVSNAYSDARREGKDVGEIYDAMARALDDFYRSAHYGELPEDATTPERYALKVEEITRAVETVNARIEVAAR